MKKNSWNLYAPIYQLAMRPDRKSYEAMCARISERIKQKEVLEIATGPGILAKRVAHHSKNMIATDFAEGMIRQARKGGCPPNLTFELADATALPYADNQFDCVIIANALHVMPHPEHALSEIHRVLKDDGVLIAPNFINHREGTITRLWSTLLTLAGIEFAHQWSLQEYERFMQANGWHITHAEIMRARIPMAYVECRKSTQG